MIAALLALSVVVVTGYVGQISLAQLAFAGVAGFTAIRLADDGAALPARRCWSPSLAAVVVGLARRPARRARAGHEPRRRHPGHRRRHRAARAGEPRPLRRPGRLAARPGRTCSGSTSASAAPGADNFRPGLRVRRARRPRRARAWPSPTCAATAPGCAGWRCGPTSGPRPRPASTWPGPSSAPSRSRRSSPAWRGVLLAYATTTLSHHVVPGHRRAGRAWRSPTWPGSRASAARCSPGCSPRPASLTTVLDGGSGGTPSDLRVRGQRARCSSSPPSPRPRGSPGLAHPVRRLRRAVRRPARSRSRTRVTDVAPRGPRAQRPLRRAWRRFDAVDLDVGRRRDRRAHRTQRRGQDHLHRRPHRLHPAVGRGDPTSTATGSTGSRPTSGPGPASPAPSSRSSCSTTSRCGRTSLVAAPRPALAVDAHRRAVAQAGHRPAVDEVARPCSAWATWAERLAPRAVERPAPPGRPRPRRWWRRPRLAAARRAGRRPRHRPRPPRWPTVLRALPAGRTAVLLVDHDMALVLGVCDQVARPRLRPAASPRGTPAEVRADPTVIAAYLGPQERRP